MKNIRVMIVDDDPMILFLHKAILQKNNIQNPLTFSNGKEAWDFLMNDAGDKYYLILLDLNMPVLNGWQFLNKLEEKEDIANRTMVAIVTSSINPADKNKAENYKFVEHFFSKPLYEYSEIKKLMENLRK